MGLGRIDPARPVFEIIRRLEDRRFRGHTVARRLFRGSLIRIGGFGNIDALGRIGVAGFAGRGRAFGGGRCRVVARFIGAAWSVLFGSCENTRGLRPGVGRLRGFGQDLNFDALFQRQFRTEGLQKTRGRGCGQLYMGLVIQHPDGADLGLGDAAGGTQHRQQPARLGILAAPHRQRQPDRGAKLGMDALGRFGGVAQFFGGRAALAPQPHKSRRDLIGIMGAQDRRDQRRFVLGDRVQQCRKRQHALVVLGGHFIGRRRLGPGGIDGGGGQQTLGLLAIGRGDDDRRNALVTGAAGATGAVQQRFAVAGQIGMDHQFQPRQIEAARRHVGGNAHPGPAIAHRLDRMAALVLRQLAGERHDSETTVVEPGHQMVDGSPGRAEHQGVFRLVKAQHIDDGVFAVGRGHLQGPVFDIDMLATLTRRGHPDGVALIALCQGRDRFGHRGREHQGAPVLGGRLQDELQIVAEAQIQHFVSLVEHGGAQPGHVERTALDMVAQPSWRADHDMGAMIERAFFSPEIHATNARGDVGPGFGIKPLQFALHLHRKFTRRGDDQRQRRRNIAEPGSIPQQGRGQGDAKGDGLARPGLCRDQRIGIGQFRGKHRHLHRRQIRVTALFQCQAKRRNNAFELCHLGLSIVRVGCLHEGAGPLPVAGRNGVAHTGERRPCIGRR